MILDIVKQGLEELIGLPAEEPAPEAPPEGAAETPEGEAPTEAAVPPPRKPVELTDYKKTGYHLDAAVPADMLLAAVELLDRQQFALECITGVDWIADNQMEVVYDFNHYSELCRVALRTRIDRNAPELPTISPIYGGANWHERETHDFFGIVFTGHPDLTPLLLPEDADFHPLLKDFKP
ncbi:MAG: NADH-quinone oxidoreductase subunit C [Deltaproteobacteria bacterium]